MRKNLVHGVGHSKNCEYTKKVDGKMTKEYTLWANMLKRCYSKSSHDRQPTYIGCSVSEEFLSLNTFISWAKEQVGYGLDGYELDKDILLKGNKVYSREVCVFVPSSINSLTMSRKSLRGDFPIGVYFNKRARKYSVILSTGTGREYLGLFECQFSAFAAYKEAKEVVIKQQANKYRGKVDDRVYEALVKYEVRVND